MLGEVADTLAQERDLHFWGSCITLMGSVAADDFGLAVLAQHDGCSSTYGPERSGRDALYQAAVAVFTDESVFYLRTTTGCKSPSARASATASSTPSAPKSRTKMAGVPFSCEKWRLSPFPVVGGTALPCVARRAPSAVSATAGMCPSRSFRGITDSPPAASTRSSVSASSTRKGPTRVRRSASRYAPQPSACPISCARERT